MLMPTTLNLFHRWNAWLCPPIGLFFNCFLIFLVQQKTPKVMRIHSRILLQTGILDILLILFTLIGQPLISCQHYTTMIFFEGYLIGLFFENNEILLMVFFNIWFAFSMLDLFGLAVQFFYRYLVLNRDIKITLRQYLCLLSCVAFVVAILNAFAFTVNYAGTKFDEYDERVLLDGNVPTKYFIRLRYAEQNTWRGMIFNAIFALLTISGYAMIGICGWKVVKYVNANLTGRKKELSKQLNRNLTIMAIIPMLFSSAIFINLLVDVFVPNVSRNVMATFEMAVFLLLHWVPVLNPLISIGTNAPYWRAVLGTAARILPFPGAVQSNE